MELSARTGRRALLKGAGLTVLGLAGGCSLSGMLDAPTGKGEDRTAETLPLINAIRTREGLPPLSVDRNASRAALLQAQMMASAGRMDHVIRPGLSFYDRMKNSEVVLPAAENIATGQDSAGAAFQAWVDSPKHLKNMLGESYRGLGVAVVPGAAPGNRPYWAMVLASG